MASVTCMPTVYEEPDTRTLQERLEDRQAALEDELEDVTTALSYLNENPDTREFIEAIKRLGEKYS